MYVRTIWDAKSSLGPHPTLNLEVSNSKLKGRDKKVISIQLISFEVRKQPHQTETLQKLKTWKKMALPVSPF